MRRLTGRVAVLVGLGALLAPASEAIELDAAPVAGTTAGEVRFVETHLRGIGEIGPFRFVGRFTAGGRSYVGTVRGTKALYDWNTFPLAYEPISIASDDGRLTGTCTTLVHFGLLDQQVDEIAVDRTIDCSVQIDGSAPTPLDLHVFDAGVNPDTISGGNGGPSEEIRRGMFVGR